MKPADVLSSLQHRVPAVTKWCKSHPLRTAAVIVSVCAVVVVMVMAIPEPNAQESSLVEDYLSALQDGHAEAAVDIADGGQPGRSYLANVEALTDDRPAEEVLAEDPPSDAFLTADALRTDWDYRTIELGEQTTDDGVTSTTVYATLVEGKREALSSFEVVEKDDDLWLVQPYAIVNLESLQAEPATIDTATVSLWDENRPEHIYFAFPGTHRVLAESSVHTIGAASEVLWVPGTTNQTLPAATVRDNVAAAAQESFEAHLDECAESTKLHPSACPFGVAPHQVHTDADFSSDHHIEDVAWKVNSYPRLEFHSHGLRYFDGQAPRFYASVIEYGYVTVSGAAPEAFEAECAITSDVEIRVPEPNVFEFFTDPTRLNECVEHQ